MELKLTFSPETEEEIRTELRKGMFQTAIFLTIKQMKSTYHLSLKNHQRSYTVAKAILQKQFPDFFPQMRLFY
ncbi:MAG: hypothetical protein NTX71_12270 [Candidatus Aureabacteria bacterium]|nr:hypothetical protein [Candidatus Auribacterota bacterium]